MSTFSTSTRYDIACHVVVVVDRVLCVQMTGGSVSSQVLLYESLDMLSSVYEEVVDDDWDAGDLFCDMDDDVPVENDTEAALEPYDDDHDDDNNNNDTNDCNSSNNNRRQFTGERLTEEEKRRFIEQLLRPNKREVKLHIHPHLIHHSYC